MLIVGGTVACAVILAGRTGPALGFFAYGGAVLWALAGVVANQYQNSLITSFTSIVCALLVAAVLFISVRRSGITRGTGQPSSPRVA
jgi:fucose permease